MLRMLYDIALEMEKEKEKQAWTIKLDWKDEIT